PARAAETALALAGYAARVASSSLFFLYGDIRAEDARRVGAELLANELIQKIDIYSYDDFLRQPRFAHVRLPEVTLPKTQSLYATVSLEMEDAALEKLSLDRCLALSVPEMHHIRR